MKTRAASEKTFDQRLQQLYGSSQMAAATVAALGLGATASAQTITAFTAQDLGSPHVAVTQQGQVDFSAGAGGPSFHLVGYATNVYGFNNFGFHDAGLAVASTFTALLVNLDRGVAIQGLDFPAYGGNRIAAFAARSAINNDPFHLATGNGTGYVGFKQNFNGHDYYGWMHITLTKTGGDPALDTLAVTNGPTSGFALAYSTGPITAGETAPIPEPASVATGLGLFALGAAGVREHRRRRQKAA